MGAVTSTGRMLRVSVMELPQLEEVQGSPQPASGVKATEVISLARGEKLVGLAPLDSVLALATEQGVVKRVNPDYPASAQDFEIIKLKPKDALLAVAVSDSASDQLTFISQQAKLLTFSADKVRPQGRTGGGMAGIKLAEGDRLLAFGVTAAGSQAQVVTVAEGSAEGPSVKVTPLSDFPSKGRATAGVRAHRFLKGEEELALAWVGLGPAKAVSAAGVARSLPTEFGPRDGSGVPVAQKIEALGPNYQALTSPALPQSPVGESEVEDSSDPQPAQELPLSDSDQATEALF